MAAAGVDPHPADHSMRLSAPSRSYWGGPEDQAEGSCSGVSSVHLSILEDRVGWISFSKGTGSRVL